MNYYHISSKLVVEEVRGHVRRKQVEQDPPVGSLRTNNQCLYY